jgi:hypothetical protein
VEIDAFLADHLTLQEGKLNVLGGGWNAVRPPSLPWKLSCGVAVIVTIPYTATNQAHKLVLHVENEDREHATIGDPPPGARSPSEEGDLRSLTAEFNIGRPPHLQPGDEQTFSFGFPIVNLPIERAEQLTFVLTLNGSEVKRLRFRVHDPGVTFHAG